MREIHILSSAHWPKLSEPGTRIEEEQSEERQDMITETRRRQRGINAGEEEAAH